MLDLVRHGMSRREIAERRGITPDGVKYHVANILSKLGAGSSAELRRWSGYPVTSPLSHRRHTNVNDSPKLGRIGQVALHARDIARAEGFYRDVLGLPHLFTFGDLTFFDCDGTRLYIRAVPEDAWRTGSILYFVVPDIAAAREGLIARGVQFSDAPHLIYRDDASGVEEWMSFFEDSEGNTLALMARVPPASAAPGG